MHINGEYLRSLRESHGLSQRELAELCGVGQPIISHIEIGIRQPSLRLAINIARTLDTSVENLIKPEADPEADRVAA